ncbi:TIGR00180 family glycosyltransferase [Allorhodopirellula heiligendammensis]|uniref:Glycosyl transferase family 2 n=1 Tax=Allorhodopirellula heiligendammensis TaxID=2714739 RepID=A0A5C6BW68_9BACT|nr:TIGR00180 family glycosyltransferase [Allorhodopirellula heiligendammensis]TWU16530.1 Glycosyl transferase family 2 [Allorhodopirellula heiligendammensis]
MTPGTLTLLTPTHNRPPFLRRMIRFFSQIELAFPIVIVDSSDSEHAAQNRRICEDAANTLNVLYRHHGLPFDLKCYQGLSEVETPYVSFCADDDFQFPAVVQQCVEFLIQNDDYSVAQGRVIHASNSRTAHDSIFDCHLLDAYDIQDSDAAERFRQIATRTFSTFYGVYRTPQLTNSFAEVVEYTDYQQGRVFTEAFLLALSVISGKVKVLPGVQYLQETHGNNESRVVPRVADKQSTNALARRYEIGLQNHLLESSGQPIDHIERLIEQHARFLSGMGSRKRSQGPWKEKLKRELQRSRPKAIKWWRNLFNHSDAAAHRIDAVVQNPHVFPNGQEYDVAKRLLTQHPRGVAE